MNERRRRPARRAMVSSRPMRGLHGVPATCSRCSARRTDTALARARTAHGTPYVLPTATGSANASRRRSAVLRCSTVEYTASGSARAHDATVARVSRPVASIAWPPTGRVPVRRARSTNALSTAWSSDRRRRPRSGSGSGCGPSRSSQLSSASSTSRYTPARNSSRPRASPSIASASAVSAGECTGAESRASRAVARASRAESASVASPSSRVTRSGGGFSGIAPLTAAADGVVPPRSPGRHAWRTPRSACRPRPTPPARAGGRPGRRRGQGVTGALS